MTYEKKKNFLKKAENKKCCYQPGEFYYLCDSQCKKGSLFGLIFNGFIFLIKPKWGILVRKNGRIRTG